MTKDSANCGAILIVEDEILVRSFLASFLKNLGYRVLEASFDEEALAQILNGEDELDVVLTEASIMREFFCEFIHTNHQGAIAVCAAAGRDANPCGQPVYKQFDFWLGEWNVLAGGKPAGSKSVQKVLGDCVISENWMDTAGRGGKSLNTYNSQKGKWQQTWMDDSGNVIEFVGEAKEGMMAYQAETTGSGGVKILHRLTFTKISDNRLRQFWEQSRDGGKTWNVAFDGDYQRKQ